MTEETVGRRRRQCSSRKETERGIKVGKKYVTHGRRPFVRRGGHLSREGGSCLSRVGEGCVLWYELDLLWCGGKEQELGIFTLNLITWCWSFNGLTQIVLLTSSMCGEEDEGDIDSDSCDGEWTTTWLVIDYSLTISWLQLGHEIFAYTQLTATWLCIYQHDFTWPSCEQSMTWLDFHFYWADFTSY